MTITLAELCRHRAGELAVFGELAVPLVAALHVVADAAGERGIAVLSDPRFVLELTQRSSLADPDPAARVMGPLLDDLRHRSGVGPPAGGGTVAGAVAAYRRSALLRLAEGSRASYGTWLRRLVAAHGGTPVAAITAGDLHRVIVAHTQTEEGRAGGQGGGCAEEMAIAAYRHLWSYLVEEGLAATNVAVPLRKPLRPESLRRPIRADQAALIRQFARMSADPLLDETAVAPVERLGLRPLELDGLRRADIDLAAGDVVIYGKGGRPRRLPLPPRLAALVAAYLEDRPTGPDLADDGRLLCRRVAEARGEVVPVGRRWTERLFARLAGPTSAVAGLSLYSYRHAMASWVDPRYGRPITRRLLGHSSRFLVTDQYIHADEDRLRDAVCAYESHLLNGYGR
jgi:integrase